MKVFVLFNGSYSDQSVVGVFSTMENAEIAARIFSDEPMIEEHEIDPRIETMRRGERAYFVRLHRDSGDTLECYEATSHHGVFGSAVGVDIHKNLHTTVWAENREHAIKIASERRRAFLALPASANTTIGADTLE